MMQVFGVKFTFDEMLENLYEIATFYENKDECNIDKEIEKLIDLLHTYRETSINYNSSSGVSLILDVVYEIYKLYLLDCLRIDNPEDQYIYLQLRLYQIGEDVWLGFDLKDFVIDVSLTDYEVIPFASLLKMKTYLQIISAKQCGIYNIPHKD
jgi:hypothetical protein